MAFLSEIIGRQVTDVDGVLVGKLKDLVAKPWPQFPHPVVEAIVVMTDRETLVVPLSETAAIFGASIPLKHRLDELERYIPAEEDFFLAQDVLDKQIIDTEGARVVRVNDLELIRVNGNIFVSNADIGGLGLLRRLSLARAVEGVAGRFRVNLQKKLLSWDNMELLRYDQYMRLKVPREKISELHPADIAEIVSDLDRLESDQLLESLGVEQLADTLEEVEPDFQASLVAHMPDERVADLLEEMDPDEAADLLAELPKERSAGLLALMEKEDAEDVRKLLTYPEESAGGIMTTEFVSVRPEMSATEAINFLRETGNEAETMFYVYVTDKDDCLVGVFSLVKLIFAQPDTLVQNFMGKRVISVELLDEQDEVAQIISKYNLLAVPVVDTNNVIQGIVTADDALDKMIPTAWKKRLPRFYR